MVLPQVCGSRGHPGIHTEGGVVVLADHRIHGLGKDLWPLIHGQHGRIRDHLGGACAHELQPDLQLVDARMDPVDPQCIVCLTRIDVRRRDDPGGPVPDLPLVKGIGGKPGIREEEYRIVLTGGHTDRIGQYLGLLPHGEGSRGRGYRRIALAADHRMEHHAVVAGGHACHKQGIVGIVACFGQSARGKPVRPVVAVFPQDHRSGGHTRVHHEDHIVVFADILIRRLPGYFRTFIHHQEGLFGVYRRGALAAHDHPVAVPVVGRCGRGHREHIRIRTAVFQSVGNILPESHRIHLPLVGDIGGHPGIHAEPGRIVLADRIVHRFGEDLGPLVNGEQHLIGDHRGGAGTGDHRTVFIAVMGGGHQGQEQIGRTRAGIDPRIGPDVHKATTHVHLPPDHRRGGHPGGKGKEGILLLADHGRLRLNRDLGNLVHRQGGRIAHLYRGTIARNPYPVLVAVVAARGSLHKQGSRTRARIDTQGITQGHKSAAHVHLPLVERAGGHPGIHPEGEGFTLAYHSVGRLGKDLRTLLHRQQHIAGGHRRRTRTTDHHMIQQSVVGRRNPR